jgi:hypothetical protein
MKNATLKAAGTVVLGVALAAAAITPAAAAEETGSLLSGLPTNGAPLQGLAQAPLSDGSQALTSRTGSVHAVTGAAQQLVDSTVPVVQHPEQHMPEVRSQAPTTRGLGGVPGLGSLPGTAGLPTLPTNALGGLPVHTPLG